VIHRVEFRITGHISFDGDQPSGWTNGARTAKNLAAALLDEAMDCIDNDAIESKSYYLETFHEPPSTKP